MINFTCFYDMQHYSKRKVIIIIYQFYRAQHIFFFFMLMAAKKKFRFNLNNKTLSSFGHWLLLWSVWIRGSENDVNGDNLSLKSREAHWDYVLRVFDRKILDSRKARRIQLTSNYNLNRCSSADVTAVPN